MGLIGKKISELIKNYSINWKNNSDKLNNSYILLSYNTGTGEFDNAVVNTKELLSYSNKFAEDTINDINSDLTQKLDAIKKIQESTKTEVYSYVKEKDDKVLSYVSGNYPTISYIQNNYLDKQNTYSKAEITNNYYDKTYIDKLIVDSNDLKSYVESAYAYMNTRVNTTYNNISNLTSYYRRLDDWLVIQK